MACYKFMTLGCPKLAEQIEGLDEILDRQMYTRVRLLRTGFE